MLLMTVLTGMLRTGKFRVGGLLAVFNLLKFRIRIVDSLRALVCLYQPHYHFCLNLSFPERYEIVSEWT